MSNSKRIFIGIPIYNSVFNVVSMMRTMIDDPEKKIRWVSGKSIHLTLSFLGNINENKIPELINDIQSSITQNTFTMSINGTGIFTNQNIPRVFWLGINNGESNLISLHEALTSAVTPYVKEPNKLNFTPHVSIARVPKNVNLGKVDCNSFLNTVYSPVEIDVNSIYLYESQLTPQRAIYSELAKFQLINTERN